MWLSAKYLDYKDSLDISNICLVYSVFTVSWGCSLDMTIVLIVQVFDSICSGSQKGAYNFYLRDFSLSSGEENAMYIGNRRI